MDMVTTGQHHYTILPKLWFYSSCLRHYKIHFYPMRFLEQEVWHETFTDLKTTIPSSHACINYIVASLQTVTNHVAESYNNKLSQVTSYISIMNTLYSYLRNFRLDDTAIVSNLFPCVIIRLW